MITHHFTSFDDIDKQLKILKLQREIDLEQMKLQLNETKNYFSPVNFFNRLGSDGTISSILQHSIAPLLANLLLTRLLRKKSKD